MLRPRAPLKTATRPLPAVLLLVAALWWAQLLGLAHGVLHAGTAGRDHLTPPAATQVSAAPATGLLAHLLAPAGDEGQCRLYDQLGHGGPLLQLPVLPAAVLPVLQAWAVRLPQRPQPCAAFEARGPPLSR